MTTNINWPDPSTVKAEPRVFRNEPRRLIRVNVEPGNGCDVGGVHAPHGESFLLVYESDLPAVKAEVQGEETARAMASAREMFARDLREHRKRCKDDETALATIGTSVEVHYQAIRGRGREPLLSLDVGPEVGPPDSPQVRQEKAEVLAEERARKSDEKMERMLSTLVDAVAKIANAQAQTQQAQARR